MKRRSAIIGFLGRVGRWTLIVLVAGFATIGFLHVTRGTAVRHVRGVSADGAPIAVSAPSSRCWRRWPLVRGSRPATASS